MIICNTSTLNLRGKKGGEEKVDPRHFECQKQYSWDWKQLAEEDRNDLMHPRHVSDFCQIWELLVDRAQEAAKKYARSYRGFPVGCAMLAYANGMFERTGLWSPWYKIFTGANIKQKPGSHGPNIHAEEIALGAAIQEGYNLIVAIVLVGETQEDHASGLTMRTLYPCGRCREFLESMPEIRPDTIVLSVSLDGIICEIMTFEEVLIRHNHYVRK